uniref:Uncharacterized protein n=1 Tax=Cacopsylla melanoneura TaxID=428564 RepID=A0A8D8UHP1_9HEMI
MGAKGSTRETLLVDPPPPSDDEFGWGLKGSIGGREGFVEAALLVELVQGANGSDIVPLDSWLRGLMNLAIPDNTRSNETSERWLRGLMNLAIPPGRPGVAGGVKNTSFSSPLVERASLTNEKLKTSPPPPPSLFRQVELVVVDVL